MILKRAVAVSFVVVLLGLVFGCSSGDHDPIRPEGENAVAPDKLVQSGSDHMLWGLYDCYVDTSNGQVSWETSRTAAFTANLNNILAGFSGSFSIGDLDLTDYMTEGRLDCTVTLKHPFPGLDKYHGFDVWGIFLHEGASTLEYQGLSYSGGPDSMGDEAVLLNADGYTRWFNWVEFDGTGIPLFEYTPGLPSNIPSPTAMLNPYRIFADGLEYEDDYYDWISLSGNTEDRNIFRSYGVNSRRYELQFPLDAGMPVLNFQFAIIATWEPGDPELTGDPVNYEPGDFPSSANVDEPFFIGVSTAASDLYYEDPSSFGGTFRAAVEVFDWQGGEAGGNGVINEVNELRIEGSFVAGGEEIYTQIDLTAIASPGTTTSSVFDIEITGCAPDASGDTDFWVIVESASLNGETYGQGFPTAYPDAPRAAFLRSVVNVSDESPNTDPFVTSVDPGTVPFWSMPEDVIINGGNFSASAELELRKDGQPSVVPTDLTWLSSSSLECDFDLRGVDSGEWDVVVINPGDIEGVLEDGFVIDAWSEEYELPDTAGSRLPRMAETVVSESIVMVAGNMDNTIKSRTFDLDWSGTFDIIDYSPGHTFLYLTSDPVNDYAYLWCDYEEDTWGYRMHRWHGDVDTWDTRYTNNVHLNEGFGFTDPNGGLHTVNSTISAFGHVIHCRANDWDSDWILPPHWFPDNWNDKTLSDGNIWTQDSSGYSYVVYDKDRAIDPYSPEPGPRSVRLGIIPPGDWIQPVVVIEESMDAHVDSPAITCMSDDSLYVAYRHFQNDIDTWHIACESSVTGGSTWESDTIIWSDIEEPEEGYIYLLADPDDGLHSLYQVGDYLEYRQKEGSAWSDTEIVNVGADDNPPGTSDFTPNTIITADGVMHFVWIRGDESGGWGEIVHRMRDLL